MNYKLSSFLPRLPPTICSTASRPSNADDARDDTRPPPKPPEHGVDDCRTLRLR